MTKKAATKKGVCGPLSHSSATLLRSCEQAYVYYKVKGVKRDSDYKKSDALSIGSAVHHIQEKSRHVKVDTEILAKLLKECGEDQDVLLPAQYRCLVHAMTVKYWRLQKASGFKVLEVEFMLENETTLIKVDAILEEPDGTWWVVDVKTARTLNVKGIPLLPQDPQLNLYASFFPEIAEKYGLSMEKFGGTRWRVVTKPTLKRRKEETDLEYTLRIIDSCKTYDLEIPRELLHIADTRERHIQSYTRSKQLYSPKAKPMRNYAHCMSYFSPCEYWSNCHGNKLYSDTTIKITEGP